MTPTRRADALAATFVLAGLAAALILGVFSDGFYHDDDIGHYLFARDGWDGVTHLLHRWARPGYNIPTAVVAHFFGFAGCRVFSALQTAVVAWAAYRIAGMLLGRGVYAAGAAALVWLQPLTLRLAYTSLTETTAAMHLTVGLWLYLRGRRIWGCALIGLMFVTRDETMALAPIMAAAVFWDAYRQAGGNWRGALRTGWAWWCSAAIVWAVAAYWAAAWLLDLPADASPLSIFSKTYTPEYGAGPWYWFLAIWPEQATVGILALAVGGAVAMGRKAWLITAWVLGLIVLHSVIFARGMFESGGYSRFLVPVSGLLAVLAAGGLKAVLAGRGGNQKSQRRKYIAAVVFVCCGAWGVLAAWTFRQLIPAGYLLVPGGLLGLWAVLSAVARDETSVKWMCRLSAAVAILLAVVHVGVVTRPLRLDDSPMHRVLLKAVRFASQGRYADRPVLSQHVLVQYLCPGSVGLPGNEQSVRQWRLAGKGTLFFWENKYCVKPLEPRSTQLLVDELARLGRPVFRESTPHCRTIVYERTAR